MKLKRPWNRISTPVYSLITFDKTGAWNANICTYCAPVSMEPKHYLIALDPKSKTHENFSQSENGYLQLLSEKNLEHINFLGKKSGKNTPKYEGLKPILKPAMNTEVLPHLIGLLKVQKKTSLGFAQGDHELFIVEITEHLNLETHAPLNIQDLIEAGIILRSRS